MVVLAHNTDVGIVNTRQHLFNEWNCIKILSGEHGEHGRALEIPSWVDIFIFLMDLIKVKMINLERERRYEKRT